MLVRLTALRTELYDTAINGTVVVTTDGETFEVSAEPDSAPVPVGDRGQGDQPVDPDADEAGEAPSVHQHDHAPGDGSCTDGRVDLNHAALDALEQIVHIGEGRARVIVSRPPFATPSRPCPPS